MEKLLKFDFDGLDIYRLRVVPLSYPFKLKKFPLSDNKLSTVLQNLLTLKILLWKYIKCWSNFELQFELWFWHLPLENFFSESGSIRCDH